MIRKKQVIDSIQSKLSDAGFNVISRDEHRPWGAFLVVDESQALDFVRHFFDPAITAELDNSNKLSPKILMVAPGHRLSWQYHMRRAEIWKCIEGVVEVITSDHDHESQTHILHEGEVLRLRQGERHRLVGLNDWGIIAEIWEHTDAQHPSDESDIVRLQDDYSRE